MSSVALEPSTPEIRNRPLASVWVPSCVPRTVTCAFASGVWLRSSTTPETVPPWPRAVAIGANSRGSSTSSALVSVRATVVLLVTPIRVIIEKYDGRSILKLLVECEVRRTTPRARGKEGKKTYDLARAMARDKETRQAERGRGGFLERKIYCRVVIAITPPM